MDGFSLEDIQSFHLEWATRNFGVVPAWQPLLGVVEEVGELAHAYLKEAQGIRLDEDLKAKQADAVGDVILFMMHFCNLTGLSFEQCIQDAWDTVKERDWNAHRKEHTK